MSRKSRKATYGYVFVWSSEGWLGIERPLEGRLSTAHERSPNDATRVAPDDEKQREPGRRP